MKQVSRFKRSKEVAVVKLVFWTRKKIKGCDVVNLGMLNSTCQA